MIRFKIKELVEKKSFKDGVRIRLEDVAVATGIHRVTLTNISSPRGANTTTDNLDRMCHYFGCRLDELVEYIPSEPPPPRKKPTKKGESSDE
ncbi:helix-turn-helix transcriptional regulator [Aquabacterium sp. A08]|uniref:helix-turn-helix domain-containing protein n=1 Tax=Aquabacterium sp. A08 TaxID=2718532 RepID=UPI00141DE6F7|nr:helix-turn-helix transcriptional regulator [Aquabacterium sp. A08]NIC42636.1 helix-turn-helix transcriptional regulator [Aquabacterium sp. A08]